MKIPRLSASVVLLVCVAAAVVVPSLRPGTAVSDELLQVIDPIRSEPETEITSSAKKRSKTLLGSIFGRLDEKEGREPQEERRLDPDRPHFPEASTTVGKGRVMLESGYTFSEQRSSFSHSYPEAVLRIGLFADWFEFRIGQNVITEQQTGSGSRRSGTGAQDLYLGAKLALIEQKQYRPAIAVLPQVTVPTGSRLTTADTALPGVNVDSAWEVVDGVFNIELLIATNAVRDTIRRSHVELATGLTAAVNVTPTLEAFVEWDAFYPLATADPSVGPRHSAIGGLVYFISKNLAVDLRAGVGLNDRAYDVIAGTGLAIRY